MADDEGSGSALSELESEVEQQQAQQQQEQEQGKRRSTRTATVTARNSKGKQKASDTSALPKRKTGKRKRGQQGAASDEDDNDEATDIPVPSPSHFQQRQQQKQKPQRRRDASTGGHDSNDGGPERDEQGNELEEEDDEESDTVTEDGEHDDDFRGPSTSKRAAAAPAGGKKKGRNGGARTTTATNGRRAAPRQAKKTAPTAAELAAAVRKRGAGAAGACAPGEDDNGDAEQPATSTRNKDDFDIQPDNVIFNTVKNPKSAMEGSVQDWVEQYQADEDSRGEALAELVNFVLRCCGCNLSVDRHEAQDLDGIVDKLDDIQADFSKVQQASYPLASKSKAYKKFRESLHDFFSKFIDACSTSDILYDDVLCETLQSWLVAASSSKLRAFRHTATVLALLLVRALCEVAVGVSKDFADLQKQKDTEVKKRKADQSRLKVLEGRIKDTHSNKIKIERYFKEIFDAVFVHRYRDAEPSIRMECIKALGGWMDVLPDYFLEGNYLRYIGWMLTDLNKEVRHEATDCLSALYDKDVYIGSMSHFTERFKSRLVEMALSDADAGVRCAAVDVLAAIDGHSLLEDEQRDEIATLVYDSEQRVRFAVAPFIRSLVEEELRVRKESLGVERGDFDEDAALTDAQRIERDALLHQRMQYKILAELMVKSAKHLEAKTSSDAAHNDHDDDDDDEGGAPRLGDRARSDMALRRGEGSTSATQLAALLQGQDKDRLTMAIECLRKDVVLLQNWQSILDYLMLDHSASSDGGASETATTGTYSNGGMRPPKQTGSQKQQDQTEGQPSGNQADKNYRLEEDEETLMLGALVSSIRTAHYRATLLPVTADDERDKILETLTRSLVRTLPALFARHQADPTRCLLLLVLPQQMKLDMYLDMRVVSSYESLWDDVTKQYLSHTDVLILERAMETIRFFAAANSLAATNKEKKAQLKQAVLAPLRKIASEAELHKAVLDEDTIGQLETSLTRLTMIAKNWDVTAVMDEKEDGNASSIVDIVTEILDRGSMGFTEEEKMVSRTLELLSIDLLWRIVKLSADEQTPTAVIELRDMLVERATEYALGRGLANIPDGIKTAAFKALLDLRIVAKNRYAATEDPVDEVELDIQAQYRCAGFVQAQIERYASMICASAEDDDIVNESEDELDEEQPAVVGKNRKASAGRGGNNEIDESRSVPFKPQTLAQHAAEYAFNDLIASFSRALCTDVIDLTHASTVLAHHDRFGPFYDECNKWLAEALRHYGVLGDAGSAVAGVVTDSLKAALGLYLKSASRSDAHFMALARLLSNHIVVRKGFSIVKRLPSRDLVSLHTASIDHVASKVATLESQDKNTSRNKALAMFKALTLCAAGLTGKEAASIHAHVVKAFENHSVVPSATSKYWEPYRAYEKKLVSLMSKDTGIKAAARRQVKKTTDASGENGQDSGDGNGREDGEGFKMPRAAKPRAAAKPKTVRETALPSRRSARASNIGTAQYADEDSDVDMDDEEALLPARPQVQKPTARPATRKEAAPAAADTPSAPSTDLADDGDEDDDAVMPGAGRASDTSALPRRKTVPAKRVREASPPPFAGSLLLGGTPTFPAPPSPAAAGTPDAPSVDRASTPEVGQREDDLDSLAGVPDSPPRFSASQMSQQSEETEALPPPGKRRRAMF